MQKIISIHLSGKAYTLEEGAHVVLRDYLERAERQLKDNPDRSEIMSDLERSIGDRCNAFLNRNKDVITTAEIEQIIKDMGPVDSAAAEAAGSDQGEKKTSPSKRLYLIREGAWMGGVCTGLAAYFHVDVTLVRLAFVLLTVFTSGVWILVYIILMIVVPYANTAEERATAHGEPFSAQEIINRAKETYSKMTSKR